MPDWVYEGKIINVITINRINPKQQQGHFSNFILIFDIAFQ